MLTITDLHSREAKRRQASPPDAPGPFSYYVFEALLLLPLAVLVVAEAIRHFLP